MSSLSASAPFPLSVRAATAADRDGWARLRYELWPDCPPDRHRLEVEQLLATPGLVAVATTGSALIGFAEVSVRVDHVEGTADTPVPYLEGWYVSAAQRGRGVGRALVAFVEDWARARGFRELASDAELANPASHRAHAALGFREVGRTVHFVKPLARSG